jgi:transposase
MAAITPYQDPAFGERPTYERRHSSSRTRDLVEQQDKIMTDAYDMSTEMEEGGASIREYDDE